MRSFLLCLIAVFGITPAIGQGLPPNLVYYFPDPIINSHHGDEVVVNQSFFAATPQQLGANTPIQMMNYGPGACTSFSEQGGAKIEEIETVRKKLRDQLRNEALQCVSNLQKLVQEAK